MCMWTVFMWMDLSLVPNEKLHTIMTLTTGLRLYDAECSSHMCKYLSDIHMSHILLLCVCLHAYSDGTPQSFASVFRVDIIEDGSV